MFAVGHTLRLEEVLVLCALAQQDMPIELVRDLATRRVALDDDGRHPVFGYWACAVLTAWSRRFEVQHGDDFVTFPPQTAIKLRRPVEAWLEPGGAVYCVRTGRTYYVMQIQFWARRQRDLQRMRDRTYNAMPSWMRRVTSVGHCSLTLCAWVAHGPLHNIHEAHCVVPAGCTDCTHEYEWQWCGKLKLYECDRRHNGLNTIPIDQCDDCCLMNTRLLQ